MTIRYISPFNTYLPTATSQVIAYTRSPSDFAINDYVQYVGHEAPTGVYHELDRDQPVRVVSVADFEWAPGDDRPKGHHNLSRFTLAEFRCERKAIPFTLDLESVELARKHGKFDPVTYESMQCACQAMTLRTRDAMTILDASGNYLAANVKTATNWAAGGLGVAGGKWDVGTSAAPYFKASLLEMARTINLQTNGKARFEDLILVLSPTAAVKISNSQEMHDYIKSSPLAERMITGELRPNLNENWALPARVQGIKICVENTPYVSTRAVEAGTAGTRAYVKSDDDAFMVYRPGGMDGIPGSKSFASIQMFYYKYEMAVDSRTDEYNQKVEGHVIDWRVFKMVASPTAAFASDILT